MHRFIRSMFSVSLFVLTTLFLGCGASSDKTIESFSFTAINNTALSSDLIAQIDQDARTIQVVVPQNVDLNGLVASFVTTGKEVTVNGELQISGVTANNYSFLAAKPYTVIAEDGTQQSYDVFLKMGDIYANRLVDFRFSKSLNPGLPYDIVGAVSHKNGEIELRVPQAFDVTALIANFEIEGVSAFANGALQVSGQTANNFSAPVSYSFLSAQGHSREYLVTVNEESCPSLVYEGYYSADSEEDLLALTGYSAINGSLYIGQSSSGKNTVLSSLQGLECINHVEGVLRVRKDSGLTNLEGLNQLFSIRDQLELDDTAVSSLSGLDNLAVSGGLVLKSNQDFIVFNGANNLLTARRLHLEGNAVVNFTGIDTVENVDSVTVAYNTSLENFEGLENVSELSGNLTVSLVSGLINFNGLDNLRVAGALKINNAAALNSFSGLSNLETVVGLDVIDTALLTSLSGLDALTEVSGAIQIQDNAQLLNLDALSGVKGTIGSLRAVNNPLLSSLSGLAGITAMEQGIYIENMPALVTLQGLQNITSVSSLRLYSLERLVDLDGLASLESSDSVNLIDNAALEHIEGLSSLKRMDDSGQLWIKMNPNLSSLHGLHNANGVRTITVEQNDQLQNLQGLNSFNDVYNVKVLNNPLLVSLDGLDALADAHFVTIENNPMLASLDGLSGLESNAGLFIRSNRQLNNLVGLEGLVNAGSVYISDNSQLQSLAGLDNLERGIVSIINNVELQSIASLSSLSVASGGLVVQNNPVLTEMDFDALCWVQGSLIFENNDALCTGGIEQVRDQVLACNGIGNETIITNNKVCE